MLALFSAFSMFDAMTVAELDHRISSEIRLPSTSRNRPDVMFGLNVTRCTSLVGMRLVGDADNTASTWPVGVTFNSVTGWFCSEPPKMIEYGPPSAPITEI